MDITVKYNGGNRTVESDELSESEITKLQDAVDNGETSVNKLRELLE